MPMYGAWEFLRQSPYVGGLSRLTIYWIGTIYTAVFDDLAMSFEQADVDNLANQISAT